MKAVLRLLLPVVEEYWIWDTQQTRCDAPISPVLRSFLAYSNPYDQASIDLILSSIEARMPQGPGRLMLAGRSRLGASAPPSASGRKVADELRASGWKVVTN